MDVKSDIPAMPTLFDTHAHLDDDQLRERIADVLKRAKQSGVQHCLAVGTTADSSEATVRIAEEFPTVFAAVGVQPNHAATATDEGWRRIRQLAQLDCVKAIGETGLDHYWDYAPMELQRQYFVRHMKLAEETQKPLVIHMREPKQWDPAKETPACGNEILEMLEAHRPDTGWTGIMHSFTGDWPLAERALAMGLHISFAGMVTFKSSDALRAVAKKVPADRLLIETDAPYLSPHPVRGQRPNEPAFVQHTAECLAQVRDLSIDELAETTTANACRLFGLTQ